MKRRYVTPAGLRTPLQESLALLKASERQRVRVHKERKAAGETANPLNKELYINAYVESEGLAMQRRRTEQLARVETQLLPTAPSDVLNQLTLALSSQQQQQKAVNHNKVAPSTRGGLTTSSSELSSFGSWRQPPAPKQHAAQYKELALHCIVRGACSPVSFSLNSLFSGIPRHAESVKRLMEYVSTNRGGARMNVVLSKLRDCQEVVGELRKDQRHTPASRLTSLLLHHVGHHCHWKHAMSLYAALRQDGQCHPTHHGIALLESMRYHAPIHGSPPLPVLRGLLAAMMTNGTAEGARGRIESPVVAAPFFALLRPPSATWEDVLRLVPSLSLQSTKKGRRRWYLPDVALGEMLKAMHRTNAPLSIIQQSVDRLTDDSEAGEWEHANQHMRMPHLYTGYLQAAEWTESLQILEHHMPHYGCKPTASSYAAVMQSMTRSGRWDLALTVYSRLQQKGAQGPSSLLSHTAHSLEAYFEAMARAGNSDDLATREWARSDVLGRLLSTEKPFGSYFGSSLVPRWDGNATSLPSSVVDDNKNKISSSDDDPLRLVEQAEDGGRYRDAPTPQQLKMLKEARRFVRVLEFEGKVPSSVCRSVLGACSSLFHRSRSAPTTPTEVTLPPKEVSLDAFLESML